MIQPNTVKREFLAIAANDAVIILDMTTEKIVQQLPLGNKLGVFQLVKVVSEGSKAFIVGVQSTVLSEFSITLTDSQVKISPLISVDTTRQILDMDAFFHESTAWVVVLSRSGAASLSLFFYKLMGTSTDFNMPLVNYE